MAKAPVKATKAKPAEKTKPIKKEKPEPKKAAAKPEKKVGGKAAPKAPEPPVLAKKGSKLPEPPALTKKGASKKSTKEEVKAADTVMEEPKSKGGKKGGEKVLDLCLLLDCTGSMASWI